MNDLQQIKRANQASVTHTAMTATRAIGKFAIAKYDGLHLMDHFEAEDKAEAEQKVAAMSKHAGVSVRFEILPPTH